ncbi:MAG: hypothetical protein J5545_12225 [Bacteroidaceae bacterium]|nr:hypothetical protein [Bacteroidaceae bacterium]
MKTNGKTTKKTRPLRQAPAVKGMQVTLETLRGRQRQTLSNKTMDELVELLRGGDHENAVQELRRLLPSSRGLTMDHDEIWHVPRVCPAGAFKKQKGAVTLKHINGLLLLDIQDVYDSTEAERIKERAALLPMTVAAFVGSSAMSVKVLVSFWPQEGVLPPTFEEYKVLHCLAHQQARSIYEPVLKHPVKEADEQAVAATFRLSIDPEPVYRPEATPMRVATPSKYSTSVLVKTIPGDIADGVEGALDTSVPPADGRRYWYYGRRFQDAVTAVNKRFLAEHRDTDIESQAFREALTAQCLEMKIPLAEARERITAGLEPVQQLEWSNYVNDYYATHTESVAPDGKMATGVREMRRLMAANYEIYRNDIDGVLYCRRRTTWERWEPLTLERQRTMELEILEAGVLNTAKPVQLFLQSDLIPRRNPLQEFLEEVTGQWDEHDRITELARCVVKDNPLWEKAFHVWFIGMVRQWMGIHNDHGNDMMPLLCGPQGTGKSTFCRTLLPEELRWGYLDHIDLSKRTELMRQMAQTLLINIDEFDQYRGDSQRGPLKNLLQQADVRTTKKWRSNMEIRQRLASFIATCNPTEVLVDETGSRRFICVRVEKFITVPDSLDRRQLYAQAVDEIHMRRLHPDAYAEDDVTGRCYLTEEEREDVERSNRHFRVQSAATERFQDFFEPLPHRHLKGDTSSLELTRSQIADYLQRHTEKKFNREDIRQLNAHLEQLVAEGKLFKRRTNESYKYHLKRKQMPAI